MFRVTIGAPALTEIVVSGMSNPLYASTDTIYGANGKPASETWYRSDDLVYQTKT